jgi:hypothetical protein
MVKICLDRTLNNSSVHRFSEEAGLLFSIINKTR